MECQLKKLVLSVDDKIMKTALKDFEFHVRAKNLSPKTISVYGERLSYFYKYIKSNSIDFKDVDRHTIQDYILFQKERGLKDISINGQILVLRIFFKYLFEEEMIEINPAEKIPLLKTEKRIKPIISEENMQKLLSVPDKRTFTGMRNFCMLMVFYDTLIRLGELTNIRLNSIDLESGTICIFGKGRKERIVPFGASTAKYLYRFIRKYRKDIPGDVLFSTKDGRILDHRNVSRILERIGKHIGVHVNPHLIRHSAASHRAMSGMPAFLLQRLLGHTTIQMTQRYVHLVDDEKLKEAFKQYSPPSVPI